MFKVKTPMIRGSLTSTAKAMAMLLPSGLGKFSAPTVYHKEVSRHDSDVEQLFELHETTSDHLAARFKKPVGVSNKGKPVEILSLNLMMPNKNAFAKKDVKESPAAYRKRYTAMLDKVKEIVDNNPDIGILVFQEAPVGEEMAHMTDYINTHFSEEWQTSFKDGTRWGVFSIISNQRLNTTEPTLDETLTAGIDIKDIDIRCRTFSMCTSDGNLVKFTNLHLPHGDPITAFKAFMTNVVKEIIQKGSLDKPFTHNLVGDYNIEATKLDALIKEIIKEEMKLAPEGTVFPFHLHTELHSSHEGHLKKEGIKLSVDNLLILNVEPAKEFHYTFEFSADRASVEAAAMITATVFAGAVAFSGEKTAPDDEAKETEQQDNPIDPFSARI
jgi:exonuclease III